MTNEDAIKWLNAEIHRAKYIDTLWLDCVQVEPLMQIRELLITQQPHVMTLEEVITSKFGQTIWLESYFDGITSLEAFLVDIECSNKPVLVNGRYEFYNLDAIEIDKAILSTFHETYKVKKYRFWSAKPTDEQREATPWDVGTVTG